MDRFASIPIEALSSLPFQVRSWESDPDLTEMAETIQTHGLIEPLVVRPRQNGLYEIINGERRLRSAKLAGLREVPCVIKEMSDQETYECQMIENIQRKDLADIEKARWLEYMLQKFPEAYPTQENLAKRVGKTQQWVSYHLAMLKLPEEITTRVVKETGKPLTEGQAREILAAPAEKREEVVEKVVEEITPKKVELPYRVPCAICDIQTSKPIVFGDQYFCSEEHFERAKSAGKLKAPSVKKIKKIIEGCQKCPINPAHMTNKEARCSHFDMCPSRTDPRCPAKGSTVKLQFITRGPIPVQCAGCTLKTIDPQKHTDGKFYCPFCYDKLTKPKRTAEEKPALPPPPTIPKPSVETPQKPKTEPYVYKPTDDSWAYRKAQMSPAVSKFEEKVAIGLERSKLPLGEAQGLIMLPHPVPDRTWQTSKGCMVAFLDGPPHRGREDRDRAVREALRILGVRVVEIKYEHDSDQAVEEAVETIAVNLKEMGMENEAIV